MTEFTAFIRRRRREVGATQAEVARAIGIASPDYICLVEQGRRSIALDRIPRLAQVLQTDAAELCWRALQAHSPQLYASLPRWTAMSRRSLTALAAEYAQLPYPELIAEGRRMYANLQLAFHVQLLLPSTEWKALEAIAWQIKVLEDAFAERGLKL